jgi:hypothetical protein
MFISGVLFLHKLQMQAATHPTCNSTLAMRNPTALHISIFFRTKSLLSEIFQFAINEILTVISNDWDPVNV